MRFLLTIVLLMAVVMVVVDAHSRARYRRYRRNHRIARKPSAVWPVFQKKLRLKNIGCHSVKRTGLCQRCCGKTRGHYKRSSRAFQYRRRYLKNLKCRRVKKSGICDRCCDQCYKVRCKAPLTCARGVCKCNGHVCKEGQTCSKTSHGTWCVDNRATTTPVISPTYAPTTPAFSTSRPTCRSIPYTFDLIPCSEYLKYKKKNQTN